MNCLNQTGNQPNQKFDCPGKKSEEIKFRIDLDRKVALVKLATKEDLDLSDIMRRAVNLVLKTSASGDGPPASYVTN